MDARTPDQNQAVPGTVFTPRQVRILKVAVIVMGILLVGGFALVLGAIVYQASNVGKSATRPSSPPATTGEASFSLPPGAQVRSMTMDGDRIALHVETGGSAEIVVLDMASGKVLSRIRLRPQ